MSPFKYARLMFGSGGTTMRLCKGKHMDFREDAHKKNEDQYYYRDAGDWGIFFKIDDGKIIAVSKEKASSHLDGLEFKEISKEEWAKENKIYDELE